MVYTIPRTAQGKSHAKEGLVSGTEPVHKHIPCIPIRLQLLSCSTGSARGKDYRRPAQSRPPSSGHAGSSTTRDTACRSMNNHQCYVPRFPVSLTC